MIVEQLVRPAVVTDADALLQLELEAREHLLEQRGGPQLLSEQAAIGEWGELIGRNDRAVFIGEIDGVVVAFLELAIEGSAATVRQAYVHPEARELGFGDDMLAMATARAIDEGCAVIEGTALPGDRNTKNFFETFGLKARALVVHKSLGER